MHGNYAPYKYDLRRFPRRSDPVRPGRPLDLHVLTSPPNAGPANIDFVIFSDRWLVAENTFRPPCTYLNVIE